MKSTMIPTLPQEGNGPALVAEPDTFRQPAYDCQEHRDGMKLTLYVPGVDGHRVEIEGRGSDLTITARKAHVLRVNFSALHLESVQRDYRLTLRLGHGFDYSRMTAEMTGGVLTVALPKRARSESHTQLGKVA